ncbi:anthrax toxin receptor-like isoform X2 [Erinaceus europaeus]|uniref:Anthrax toxin receptor-like isoform X2 n=1 Tax=Erinaceus europaeus TaxID=9365 RepID=A0ABM3XE00_ERIEU|nr:anthrax toxin receptor-like isoform X2 [Erinaceus europaeus]
MGSGSSIVPGSSFFLLLLLLLLPLLSMGSFQYRLPGWLDFHHLTKAWRNLHRHFNPNKGRSYHHRRMQGDWSQQSRSDDSNSCQSEFDIYFVLDMSGSVDNNWVEIYNLVEELVKRFKNPKVRLSFILYSTYGQTVMELTSDKTKIAEGLEKLKHVAPIGATHMQEGLKKANEQIFEATEGGKKPVQSMILALTDGTLDPGPFKETKEEAAKARQMGATIYGLGIKDYWKEQLEAIADSKKHVFGVNTFQDLKSIVEPLTKKSCISISRVEASSYCVGDDYEVLIIGRGFKNIATKDNVVCKFSYTRTEFFEKHSTFMNESAIKCPGVRIEKLHRKLYVEVSLDNGATYLEDYGIITSKRCQTPVKVSTTPRLPVAVPTTTTTTTSTTTTTTTTSTTTTATTTVTVPTTTTVTVPTTTSTKVPEVPPARTPAPHKIQIKPLYLAIAGAGFLVILFPIGCCCIRTVKETVPILVPYVQSPLVVVPCCECQDDMMKEMEGRCYFNLSKASCAQLPCCQNFCLKPSQEYCTPRSCCSWCQHPPPISSRPSRMLPFISPPARILCGTPLSLPPP